MADIINLLSALNPDSDLAAVRFDRSEALLNSQRAFDALLEPADPGTFTAGERYAVASYVAGVHGVRNAVTFYSELMLDDAPVTLRDAVLAAVAQGHSNGPYGTYREAGLAGESEPGGTVRHDADSLGDRLAAAFEVAHLMIFHPRDARPEVLGRLSAAGWSADDTVSLVQLIAFLTYQLRVIHGLQVINGHQHIEQIPRALGETPAWELSDTGFEITTYPELVSPEKFVSHPLRWRPWLAPVREKELDEQQREALTDPAQAGSPIFRLLARDPLALKPRTLLDADIFDNPDGGIGRAERELAATVASRLNGCVYCVSLHAPLVIREVEYRTDDVQRLLDQGVAADLGDERWNAIAETAAALTTTPIQFSETHVERLANLDLDATAVIDLINATASLNWANRLMLLLGEPELPARFRTG